MRLSNFIQETLYEIALGVQSAKLRAQDLVAINPAELNKEVVGEKSYVDFDVTVVVTETKDKKHGGDGSIGGEIKVASIASIKGNAGAKTEHSSSTSSEHTQRVSFKVPVYFAAHFRGDPGIAAEKSLLEEHLKNDKPIETQIRKT
ncbi:MAG: hypothetical protein P4L61_01875 [Candidatus Pacebacteria bacterium]|nr:hypothetical protein [Candidatus Paceibacterota bacterium]